MSPKSHTMHDDEDGFEEREEQNEDDLSPKQKRRREERRAAAAAGDKKHKKKSTKIAVMADSNLTDAERREIRREQRLLQQNIKEGGCADIEDLEGARNVNNDIFKTKVCYTREAVLDAENVGLIATQYAIHVEKQVQVPRFDAIRLAQKLVQKCTNKSSASSEYFDWKLLGAECGICFNALPDRVTFFAGALDQEVTLKVKQARKARPKAVVDESAEIRPENVSNDPKKQGVDADKLSAMEKAMNVMRKKLTSRSKEEADQIGLPPDTQMEVDGTQFLVNPKSFTQTVENVFNYSFLVKRGEGEIGIRNTTSALNDTMNSNNKRLSSSSGAKSASLYVKLRISNPDEMAKDCTQAVCSFTMADWRRLVVHHDLQQGDLPHRAGTKQVRAT